MSVDIKTELEMKKARLRALREEKDRRKCKKDVKDLNEFGSLKNGLCEKSTQQDLDNMLSSLGIAPVSELLSSLSSSSSDLNNFKEIPVEVNQVENSKLLYSSIDEKVISLVKMPLMTVNILPKEVYCKHTQTDNSYTHEGSIGGGYFEDWWRPRKTHASDYYDEYNLNPGLEWEDEFAVLTYDAAQDDDNSIMQMTDTIATSSQSNNGFRGKLPPGIIPQGLPKVKDVPPALTLNDQEQNVNIKNEFQQSRKIELSDEEKQKIMMSTSFRKFLDRAGRIVERALSEQLNIFTDYSETTEEESTEERLSSRISLNRIFYDDKIVKNRSITSLESSPHYPELLLASYLHRKDAPYNTSTDNGICLVFNTKFSKKNTPEYIFHCQSAITSAIFPTFHANLVIGGTYSGQVVLFDNRVPKRTPVQRTTVSANAHTHPVYCMKVVGSHNAHNLITMSTDGTLCAWSLDMFTNPQEKMELNRQKSKPVAISCCDFNDFDVNNFVIGTEEGCAYSACRHGNKEGIIDTFYDHQGPITGINFNKVRGEVDFSDLFLTSSYDWTVKLWNVKEKRCLFTFEGNCDYVMDVAWSPIHPAVFAAVYISGRIDVWNLNHTTEVPCATTYVDGSPAFNKVSWTNSGLHLIVGDCKGKIWVFDLAENFVVPKKDDWNKFMYVKKEFYNDMIYKDMVKTGKFNLN